MDLGEDTDLATVVETTVRAIKRGAHLIGKIRRDSINAGQIAELEDAIALLQSTLDLRRRILNAPRP